MHRFTGSISPPPGKPVKLAYNGPTCDPCVGPKSPLLRPPTEHDASCVYREQTQHAPASVDPVYGEVLNNKLGLARLCSVRGRLGAPAITVTCIARVLGAMRQVTSEIGKKTNLTETGDDRMEATLTRCPKRGTVRC